MRDAGALIWIAHTEQHPTRRAAHASRPNGIEVYNLHANIDPKIRGDVPRASIAYGDRERGRVRRHERRRPRARPRAAVVPRAEPARRSTAGTSCSPKAGMVAATAGSDAHENALPMMLADGERGDSYRRVLRWFSNIVLVADPTDPAQIEAALARGPAVLACSRCMGTPEGFDVVARGRAAGELGDTVTFDATHLLVKVPTRPRPRSDAAGSGDPGHGPAHRRGRAPRPSRRERADLDVPLPGPGAYRVEISIVPHHLGPYLRDLGTGTWPTRAPWIYTSAIYVRVSYALAACGSPSAALLLAGCFIQPDTGSDDYPPPPSGGWGSGCGGSGGTSGYGCQLDSQCPARVRVRARRRVHERVVGAHRPREVDGQAARSRTPRRCSAAPKLDITFSTSDSDEFGFSPVPCDAGKFTIDKMPMRYTMVNLARAGDYERRRAGRRSTRAATRARPALLMMRRSLLLLVARRLPAAAATASARSTATAAATGVRAQRRVPARERGPRRARDLDDPRRRRRTRAAARRPRLLYLMFAGTQVNDTFGYEPVPCKPGVFTVDKLPRALRLGRDRRRQGPVPGGSKAIRCPGQRGVRSALLNRLTLQAPWVWSAPWRPPP